MKIEVGEYVRSNDGYIGKIIKIQKGKRECDTYYCADKIMASGFYEHIKKHSISIIDLIEVGDYVNGERVLSIDYGSIGFKGFEFIEPKDIKSILTKEQYEVNVYRLEE